MLCLTEDRQRLPGPAFFFFLNTHLWHLLPLHHLCHEDKFQQSSVHECAGGSPGAGAGAEDASVSCCSLEHSAFSMADEISYLNGESGSCTCCSSRTRLEEKRRQIRWKGRVRRRLMRCASAVHRQINESPLMVGNCGAEVNRNSVKPVKPPHLSHRCRFLESVL